MLQRKMNGIYQKIQHGELTKSQLEFWRDRTETMNCAWASKIHNACILQLEGVTTPPPKKEYKTSIVELKWKVS